ncbi:hypothetical protein ACHAXR_008932 [Thalassiosira sp. AJA248-18]
MSRNNRKKTDIPVPEPRHRVGPKGVVSSGISFRDLPPPSLDEIKKICEHYQQKSAGTYKSLSSRYVYQMATEIEHLVDAIKEGGYDVSEGSLSTLDERESNSQEESRNPRSKKRNTVNRRTRRSSDKRDSSTSFSGNNLHGSRPRTASGARKPSHASYGRNTREFPLDYVDGVSIDSPPPKTRHYSSSHQRRNVDSSLSHHNLEDQNEEVLRWLKEEMKRSQSLINRSKKMHDAELVTAKKEVEKVKRAAKLLIKAVHKKGKDKAAKSEATAESERRRRMKSQKMIANLIQSHSAQIDLLKKGLRHGSSRDVADDFRDHGRFYPWGELQDDKTDVSFSLSDASDLTSILDDLAEEAYHQSCC